MQISHKLLAGLLVITSFIGLISYQANNNNLEQSDQILQSQSQQQGLTLQQQKDIEDKNRQKIIDLLNRKLPDQQEEELDQNLQGIFNKGFKVDDVQKQFQGICLNGKNPASLSEQDRLKEFNEGPCSPVVLLPGVLATALQIEIECEVLQKNHPDIFGSCGWNTCNSKWYKLKQKQPKDEYRIWMGSITDPSSVFTLNKSTSEDGKCFGSLIQLNQEKLENGEIQFNSPQGIKVTILGNTPQSQKDSSCGNKAIGDLMEDRLNWVSCQTQNFSNIQKVLESMGYQAGITYQSIPYDFRLAMKFRQTEKVIQDALTQLKQFTGKKSHLITHSYGSLHAYSTFMKMDQQFKDDHVQQWIPSGGPLLGAPKIVKSFLNGDDDFVVELGSFLGKEFTAGINFFSQREMTKAASSQVDLLVRDVMSQEKYRNTEWMKQILERIEYEKQAMSGPYDESQGVPLDFFPRKSEVCRDDVTNEKRQCGTYMKDFDAMKIAEVEGKEYRFTREDIKQLIKDTSDISDLLIERMDQIYDANTIFDEMQNPGVKIVNIYGNFEPVPTQFSYEKNPLEMTKREEFYFPDDTDYIWGDGTVTSNSLLIPHIKWKLEHDQNLENSKPVRFVEMCSQYNKIDEIFEQDKQKGLDTLNESGYNGLQCGCYQAKSNTDCQHPCMIGDPYYIQFIANMLTDNQKSQMQNIEEEVKNFDIPRIQRDCELLYDL